MIRTEATGYGVVYFLQEMLAQQGDSLKGKKILVSGSGNVAQYAIEKVLHLGGTVLSASDSDGTVFIPDGFRQEQLEALKDLKNVKRGRISELAEQFGLEYHSGKTPWQIAADIALPCATQNELGEHDANILITN